MFTRDPNPHPHPRPLPAPAHATSTRDILDILAATLTKVLEAIALLFPYLLFSLTKISNIKKQTKNGHQTRPRVGF